MPLVNAQTAAAPHSARLPAARLIALFVLLSVVPLALLAFFSVRLASDAVTREVRDRVRSNAALSAVAIQKEMEGLSELVHSYAQRPVLIQALGKADRAQHRRSMIRSTLAELEQARPGITSAALADPSGVLLDVVPATPSIIGKNFSYRDWYKGVRATGRTYVSEAIVSKAAGHPRVVAVASPVRADGRVVAILVVGYGLETVHRFVERFAASQGVHLTVTDKRGVLVARPGSLPGLTSDRADPLVAAALRGRSGVTTHNVGGKAQLAAYEPISGLGWTVVAEVPKHVALARLDKLRSTVLSIVGLLGLVLVGGLALLARTLRGRRRAEDAAERSRAEAERATDEAQRANRAKSEFLSRMSHELRTPLNAILGFGQLLELEPLETSEREAVGQILKAGNHLLGLINEILDISRIEAGKLALSLEPVAAGDTVEEVLDLIRPLAAQRQIAVASEGTDAETYVRADYQRLKQVLLNLLSNAVKYNRDGGAVSALVASSEGRVSIEISDTGKGIPADQLERVFVPFERLGAELTDVEGTGLGLTLAKRLVEAMGGRLTVSSTHGEGSTFRVELDAVERPPLERAPAPARSLEPIANGSNGGVKTILYVEDNLSNLRLIEQVLARHEDLRLLSAMQGTLGLELAREHDPDLILLDLHLPDLPGNEVLARLRADPATARIPVVVLSADATPRQIERLRAQGADAYLTKPLNIRELFETLDTHLNGA